MTYRELSAKRSEFSALFFQMVSNGASHEEAEAAVVALGCPTEEAVDAAEKAYLKENNLLAGTVEFGWSVEDEARYQAAGGFDPFED